MKLFLRTTCISLVLVTSTHMHTVHAASTFNDVNPITQYAPAIEYLANQNIVRGNPGGYFYPLQNMNRAELLVLLYRAKKVEPSVPKTPCFSDVDIAAWYAPAVCDAVLRTYINGYSDGTFKPAALVNRVEALKMIISVLGLKSTTSASVPLFVDVELNAWYMSYINRAYDVHILPIGPETSTHFYPSAYVKRGEFAAYLYNALTKNEVSSSSSVASSNNSQSSVSISSKSNSSSSSAASSLETITWPWKKTVTFSNAKPMAYKIWVIKEETINITVKTIGASSDSRCTLYRIPEDGIAYEYIIGHSYNAVCTIITTVKPGNYQLQLVPAKAGQSLDVDIKTTTSDRNDAFSKASVLTKKAITQSIPAGNTHNFYTFTVEKEANMQVITSNVLDLDCLIYPMKDVDIYGFSGPICNQEYTFPTGTYYVAIKRGQVPLTKRLDFSIYLQ